MHPLRGQQPPVVAVDPDPLVPVFAVCVPVVHYVFHFRAGLVQRHPRTNQSADLCSDRCCNFLLFLLRHDRLYSICSRCHHYYLLEILCAHNKDQAVIAVATNNSYEPAALLAFECLLHNWQSLWSHIRHCGRRGLLQKQSYFVCRFGLGNISLRATRGAFRSICWLYD